VTSGGAAALGLRIWGARGSLPTPGAETVRYGGNTTCYEIVAGDATLMVDCGTGAHGLGRDLQRRGIRRVDLLMTHMHLDHIIGFPYFQPAYDEDFDLTCWSAAGAGNPSAKQVFASLTAEHVWPLGRAAVERTRFSGFTRGDTFEPVPGVTVATHRLNHPGGATGYRIGFGGRSIVIAADHEHGDPEIDAELVAFAHDADLLVYDANYTQRDYDPHRGWGHSTWEAGLALARAAGVGTPVMAHHGTERTDAEIDALLTKSRKLCPDIIAACEGMTVWVGKSGKVVLEEAR
jgi:phosphoribosyl 1,2-cyclic phosphodiesterase